MLEIIYKSKNAIVIYKPVGMPSQSDLSGDKDAMTLTSELLSECGEPADLWLIHRLDRTVSGVMIFARSKASAAELSRIVKERQIAKEYLAVVTGVPENGVMRDYLFKDSRTSKAYVIDKKRAGAKDARLVCTPILTVKTDNGDRTLVRISLDTGRFHQIRAQLSHRGHPILGDKKYGSRESLRSGIALTAYRLNISLFGENIDVVRMPCVSDYPWSLFPIEEYDRSITL